MSNSKGETLKNLMINLGIFFILTGSVVVKNEALYLFLLGLVILGLQTFDFKNTQPRKLVMAEILLSAAIAVAAITQVIMAASFKTPQVFLLIVLLGAVLVAVEAVRKYSEL